ncbi:hypothetical protein [Armatimonas rosea]|uniref:DUF2336 domain-containing protein n=1 Tax=Armatimonas rosea TaxID=685828 RepID=A0A7W9W8B6_ARMRO|nr:hypothetical protein [Armatimonas rosea]MBB6051975.1 hypothetical protein [Armatimonas rosea]
MTAEDLLAEVSNPATLPERLERLWFGFPYPQQKPGYHGSHEIRRRIAAHPNLTPKLAGRALGKYPDTVCENPVFPLLKLEAPHLVKLVPPSDMLAWLKREHCPRLFVELMLGKNWPLVSEAAKRHVSYAGYISRDELPDVLRTELIEMPKAKDDKSLKALHDVGLVPQSIAEHFGLGEPMSLPDLPGDALPVDREEEPLTEEEERELRSDLWPEKSDRRPYYALGMGRWMYFREIACNRKTKPAVLRRLAELTARFHSGLTHDLANNPSTPPDALLMLLKAGNSVYWLAKRFEVLPDASSLVHRELVAVRHCSGDITQLSCVLALANSPSVQGDHKNLVKAVNWRRRLGLALNPLTPPDLLELLSHDGNRLVNAAAKAQLETPGVRLLEQL